MTPDQIQALRMQTVINQKAQANDAGYVPSLYDTGYAAGGTGATMTPENRATMAAAMPEQNEPFFKTIPGYFLIGVGIYAVLKLTKIIK